MISAPCKDCKDRSTSCHGRCARYREWAENRRTELDLRLVNDQADAMQIESVYKIKRRRRNKL